MDLSFREKSLWLVLLSLAAIFGAYFVAVLPAADSDVLPAQVVLFVTLVVLLVVVQVVAHAVLAIIDRRHEADERDRLIELKGTRNASYVLATGVFFAICAALFVDGNFVVTHLLLGFWVIAHLVEIASQLVLYRRGA